MDQIVTRPPPGNNPDIEKALALDPKGRARKRRRGWVWTILALALLAGGVGAWTLLGAQDDVVTHVTVPVERGTLVVEVSATGTLQPVTQVDISSELSGVMREVHVLENGEVTRGQLLAELDTTRLTAQVERAEANVTAAEARVAEAQTTLDETERTLVRSNSLAERGMLADQALETATAARDRAASAVLTAQANLAVARADLRLQEADLSKSRIYSPIDGIVLTRDADPGQTVASSFSAPVLFVIAEDLTRMELQAAVDEADIGAVAIGQDARFTVDAFPERSFEATISGIAYGAVTTEGVVTYEAKLTVDNSEMVLRPGMTATVAIVTREAENVLTVPTSAFRYAPPAEAAEGSGFSLRSVFMPRFRARGGAGRGTRTPPSEGERQLYVLRDGVPQAVAVTTGATDGDRIEIVSGIEEGDRVVVSTRQGAGTERRGSAGARP